MPVVVIGCLGGLSLSNAQDGLLEQVRKVAASTKTLDAELLFYGSAEERSTPQPWNPEAAKMQAAFETIKLLAAQPATAMTCIKQPDPKVRTLGMLGLFETLDPLNLSAIASLMTDESPSFHRPQYSQVASFPRPATTEVPTTVGQIAMQLLEPYLRCAGVTTWPGDADAASKVHSYLANHRHGDFFGRWHVKWKRASAGSSPVDKARYPKLQEFRKLTEALRSPERELVQLKLWAEGVHAGDPWLPVANLLAVAKRLGRDQLLALLEGKLRSTDPDLKAQTTDFYVAWFLLDHAAELLQPADADRLLLHAEAQATETAMWAIAASRLAPEKAVTILKSVIPRHSEGFAADYVIELWKVAGVAEREFITDWFYTIKDLKELNQASAASSFLSAVRSVSPSAKALLKVIVTDPRLDQAGFFTLRDIVDAAKQLNGSPIVNDPRSIGPRWGKGGEFFRSNEEFQRKAPTEFATMITGMKEWRTLLVAAVQAW